MRLAPVKPLPTGDSSEGLTQRLTRERLESSGLLTEPKSAALLVLAARIDAASDSGSSLAALVKEHGSKLDELLDSAPAAMTPLDEIRARRERRLAGR